MAAKDELSQLAASKEEIILRKKQLSDQKSLLATSEKEVADCRAAMAEEVSSWQAKVLKLEEDLKDTASLSLLEGEARWLSRLLEASSPQKIVNGSSTTTWGT